MSIKYLFIKSIRRSAFGSFQVKSTTYGRHVTDFAEILHTIWDMKKIPEPEDERSKTSEARDMAPESFR